MGKRGTRLTNEDTQPMVCGVTLSSVKKEIGENLQPRAESGQLEQGTDDVTVLDRNSTLAGGVQFDLFWEGHS